MSSLISTRLRYGAVSQIFHWLTVVLVAMAFLVSPGGSERRAYSTASDFTRELHETTGILLFAIVLLRIVWRLVDSTPEGAPLEPWMKQSAKLVQIALYALLVAIPLTAIIGAWTEGHPLTFLGAGTVGPLLPLAHGFGQSAADLHTILGNAIIWVAGLHGAAALFHHYVLRDTVLTSMLPDWRRLPSTRTTPDQESQRPA